MEDRQEPSGWNPYVAGALSGLLLIFSVWFTGKYVGASTTFVRSAGYIEKLFDADRVAGMEYFKKELPKIDWQFVFVVGIFFGSLIVVPRKLFDMRNKLCYAWEMKKSEFLL